MPSCHIRQCVSCLAPFLPLPLQGLRDVCSFSLARSSGLTFMCHVSLQAPSCNHCPSASQSNESPGLVGTPPTASPSHDPSPSRPPIPEGAHHCLLGAGQCLLASCAPAVPLFSLRYAASGTLAESLAGTGTAALTASDASSGTGDGSGSVVCEARLSPHGLCLLFGMQASEGGDRKARMTLASREGQRCWMHLPLKASS